MKASQISSDPKLRETRIMNVDLQNKDADGRTCFKEGVNLNADQRKCVGLRTYVHTQTKKTTENSLNH